MISSTNLLYLRLLEYFETISLLYAKLSEISFENEKMKAVLSRMKSCLDALDEALVLVRGSELTSEIESSDARRDAAFVTLINQDRALMKSPVDELSAAATTVYALLERYGKDLYRQPYLQESGSINNLVQDLESASYTPLIEALGLQKSVEVLKKMNEDFDSLYSKRLAEKSGLEKSVAKIRRDDLHEAFKAFCELVNAGIVWQDDPVCKQFAEIVNIHVANAQQKVAQRLAIKKGWDDRKAESGEEPSLEPAK